MGEEALGDRWARLLGCRLGLLQRGRIDAKRLDRVVLRRVDRGADLIHLVDTPWTVATTTAVIKASRPRTISPAARWA